MKKLFVLIHLTIVAGLYIIGHVEQVVDGATTFNGITHTVEDVLSSQDIGTLEAIDFADVDGDGDIDLIALYDNIPSISGKRIYIYNSKNGGFEDPVMVKQSWINSMDGMEMTKDFIPVKIEYDDLNLDGRLDFIAPNSSKSDLSVAMFSGGFDDIQFVVPTNPSAFVSAPEVQKTWSFTLAQNSQIFDVQSIGKFDRDLSQVNNAGKYLLGAYDVTQNLHIYETQVNPPEFSLQQFSLLYTFQNAQKISLGDMNRVGAPDYVTIATPNPTAPNASYLRLQIYLDGNTQLQQNQMSFLADAQYNNYISKDVIVNDINRDGSDEVLWIVEDTANKQIKMILLRFDKSDNAQIEMKVIGEYNLGDADFDQHFSVFVTDMNLDGFDDVVATTSKSVNNIVTETNIRILSNSTDQSLGFVTFDIDLSDSLSLDTYVPLDIALSDANFDGFLDIFVGVLDIQDPTTPTSIIKSVNVLWDEAEVDYDLNEGIGNSNSRLIDTYIDFFQSTEKVSSVIFDDFDGDKKFDVIAIPEDETYLGHGPSLLQTNPADVNKYKDYYTMKNDGPNINEVVLNIFDSTTYLTDGTIEFLTNSTLTNGFGSEQKLLTIQNNMSNRNPSTFDESDISLITATRSGQDPTMPMPLIAYYDSVTNEVYNFLIDTFGGGLFFWY